MLSRRSFAAAASIFALLAGGATSTGAVAASEDTSTVPHRGDGGVAAVEAAWAQEARGNAEARQEFSKFQALPDKAKHRFVEVMADPEVMRGVLEAPGQAFVNGSKNVSDEVEVVASSSTTRVPVANRSAGAVAPSALAPIQAASLWNVTYNTRYDVKIFGIKTGHFKQEYRYTTRSNQWSIVSSDSCHGWWSGFAGFWNISSYNRHYKSGSYGYCKTRHEGSVVFKGAFVAMNKEHGSKVAGPYPITWWLKNV